MALTQSTYTAPAPLAMPQVQTQNRVPDMQSILNSMGLGAPGSQRQGGEQQSNQQSTSTSGQSFADPGLVGALSQGIGGAAQGAAGQYAGFLADPVSHPLFQGQLQALLQSLVPSENSARQGLTDQFRAAGGLRSGAYGNAGATLEGNILGNRQTEAGKLLGQAFPQIVQALLGSMGQGNQLIDALKMNQQSSQSTGSSSGTTPAAPMTDAERLWGLMTHPSMNTGRSFRNVSGF